MNPERDVRRCDEAKDEDGELKITVRDPCKGKSFENCPALYFTISLSPQSAQQVSGNNNCNGLSLTSLNCWSDCVITLWQMLDAGHQTRSSGRSPIRASRATVPHNYCPIGAFNWYVLCCFLPYFALMVNAISIWLKQRVDPNSRCFTLSELTPLLTNILDYFAFLVCLHIYFYTYKV